MGIGPYGMVHTITLLNNHLFFNILCITGILWGILTVDRKGQHIHMDCDDGLYGICYIFCQVCRRKRSGVVRMWQARYPPACTYFWCLQWKIDTRCCGLTKFTLFFGKKLMPSLLSCGENCDIITANEEIRCML